MAKEVRRVFGRRVYGPNRRSSWPYIHWQGCNVKIAGDPSEPLIGVLYDGPHPTSILFGSIVPARRDDAAGRDPSTGLRVLPQFLSESL